MEVFAKFTNTKTYKICRKILPQIDIYIYIVHYADFVNC